MDSMQQNDSCLNSTFDFRVSDIQEDLYKFHQGTLDVSKYFTHLKVLWDELENHRPIPSCSCAIPRSCSVIASVRRYREQDYVIRFLKGLNEKFTHSKSQITMMNLLLDIDKDFSLVIQQEREVNIVDSTIIPSIGNNEESIALNAQASHDAQHGKPNSYRGKYQELMFLEVKTEFPLIAEEPTIPLILVSSNMDFHQVSRTRANEMVQVLIMMLLSIVPQKFMH